MQIITLILAVLALLAAAFSLYLNLKESLRREELADSVENRFSSLSAKEKKRQTALLQYVDRIASEASEKAIEAVGEQIRSVSSNIEKTQKAVRTVNNKAVIALKTARGFSERIEKLEQGVVPDYNEALRAVNAVNDMNSGIAGIFGFDPMEALKKSRQEG